MMIPAVLLTLAAIAPTPANDPTKPVIAVELRTAMPVVKSGEFPRFTAEVVNRSNKEIVLVRPGDGSDCGWRTPVLSWMVEGVKPQRLARCGNINALKPNEVFLLKPGERASLGEWIGFPRLPGPGTYTVRLRFENKPDLKWSGLPLGKHDEAAMARVKASTPAAAESNAVRIIVRE